jgi:hypothetical protein
VKGRRFFPLDAKLQLREDSWSGGAARVMARFGVREPSFVQAAEGYAEATGGQVSGASIRRVTQGFGKQVQARHATEAERAAEVGAFEEFPHERWLELENALEGIGNVSSDGTLILVRDAGWKEVKVAVFSQVETLSIADPDRRAAQREGQLGERDVVRLREHSYCAGLWDADTFGRYQYLEGLRRGFDRLEKASSANDGARWIARITDTNFPHAQQIIDWMHGTEHLWAMGNAVFGETTPKTSQWVKQRKAELWAGNVEAVIVALKSLDLEQDGYPEVVRQAPGYFETRIEEMRYADFRNAGYPIGSGTVESAARNVVQPRMRRPGRGWNRDNADAMLAALAEFHSNRWSSTWNRIGAAG